MHGTSSEEMVRRRMPEKAIIGLDKPILEGFRDDGYAAGEAESCRGDEWSSSHAEILAQQLLEWGM